MSNIKQLREDYEELTGRHPFNGWKEEKLEKKMAEFKAENNITEVVVTAPRQPEPVEIKEDDSVKAHSQRFQDNERLRRSQLYKQLYRMEPVFLKEKPYAILDGKYVDWKEAELIALTRIKDEIEKLIEEKTAVLNS